MTGAPILKRREVVARLLRDRDGLAVVTGLGSATYDVAAAGDHPRNVYLWGAMGGAAMVGLGLALAQPALPVAVVTGDGEMLMGLGGLATIALKAPPNLRIVVLDNGLYGETGGQASHTASGVDIAAVARACGLKASLTADAADLDGLARRLHDPAAGAEVMVIRIAPDEEARVLPTRDGVLMKARMRAALGVETINWPAS